jgi:hypothetical protein
MPPNLTVGIEQYFNRLFLNLRQAASSLSERVSRSKVLQRTNHAGQLPDFR